MNPLDSVRPDGLAAVDVWVPGRPRTKGSLKVRGRRANGSAILTEAVEGSYEWRGVIVRTLWGKLAGGKGVWTPYTGPVRVGAEFHLPPPAGRSAGRLWPDRLRDGDLDKYTRNLGDALTDSGIIADDGQIVSWWTSKTWAADADSCGVRVWVGTVGV
jgi:hypothetical protein